MKRQALRLRFAIIANHCVGVLKLNLHSGVSSQILISKRQMGIHIAAANGRLLAVMLQMHAGRLHAWSPKTGPSRVSHHDRTLIAAVTHPGDSALP